MVRILLDHEGSIESNLDSDVDFYIESGVETNADINVGFKKVVHGGIHK